MSYTLALLAALWNAPLPATPPVATDSIRSESEIRLAVLRHASSVRRCYESEGLRRDPRLNGFVDVVVTIQPTGIVSEVAVTTDSLSGTGANEVGRCLAAIARHWRFDRGPYAVEKIVLPFILTPDNSAARRATIGAEH